jgi:hypothetical protein
MTLSAEVVYTSLLSEIVQKSPIYTKNIRFNRMIVKETGIRHRKVRKQKKCWVNRARRSKFSSARGTRERLDGYQELAPE